MKKRLYLRSGSKRSSKTQSPPLSEDRPPVKPQSPVDSVYHKEIGRNEGSFDLRMNRENILRGIIFAEVLGKPKGISYRKR